MKNKKIIEIKSTDFVSSIKDNQIYKYNIIRDSDTFLEMKRLGNKIICCKKYQSQDNIVKKGNYLVINYETVKYCSIAELYRKLLKRHDCFSMTYPMKNVHEDFFEFESDKQIENILLSDIELENEKKYFAIRVEETHSQTFNIRAKTLQEALILAEQLKNNGLLSLTYNNSKFEKNLYINGSHTIKDKLRDYKSSNLRREDLTYYSAFKSIYHFNRNATDEEVIKITSNSYDAWLKDEEGYSISKISDFLAKKYFDKELTLENIENASPRDILIDVISEDIYYIENDEKKVER